VVSAPRQPKVDLEIQKTDNDEFQKNRRHTYLNKASGCWNYRIPYTHFTFGSALSFVVFIIINILCLTIPGYSAADAWGYLAAANSLIVGIPATRNSVITWLTGMPFDKSVMFHRWIGRWLMLTVFVHMGLYWHQWQAPGAGGINANTFDGDHNMYGWLAWFFGVILLVTSVEWMRRRKFEFFYYSHYFFVLFYVFAALHTSEFRPYLIATLFFYILDRSVRFFWGLWPVRATLIKTKVGKVIQIRFPKHPVARCAKLYKVGQYCFLNFPQLSVLEWHPFSISSGPDDITGEVHIKALGDHTAQLVELVKRNDASLWLRVDGPYGNHNLNYRRYPNLMLVAGGVGITPILGIVKDIYRVGDMTSDMRRLIRPHCMQAVHVVWVMPSIETFDWFIDEFAECLKMAGQSGLPFLKLYVYATKSNFNDMKSVRLNHESAMFMPGRPEMRVIFDRMMGVSDEAKVNVNAAVAAQKSNMDETPQVGDASKTASIFVCGPPALVNDCWDCSCNLSVQGFRIDFHHETFEF